MCEVWRRKEREEYCRALQSTLRSEHVVFATQFCAPLSVERILLKGSSACSPNAQSLKYWSDKLRSDRRDGSLLRAVVLAGQKQKLLLLSSYSFASAYTGGGGRFLSPPDGSHPPLSGNAAPHFHRPHGAIAGLRFNIASHYRPAATNPCFGAVRFENHGYGI